MAGGTSRRGSARDRPRARRRAARGVLGNDPFTRGAAPRTPLAAAPPTLAPGPSTSSATSTASARVDTPSPALPAAPDAAERTRLAGRSGLRGAGQELQLALERLLPRLAAGLASVKGGLAGLEQLVHQPDPGADPYGLDPRLAERFAPLAELLYATWWRTVVREQANVPATGPAIVYANHAGIVPWDALVLRTALRRDHPAHRDLRPLLDERECSLPLVGGLAVRLGAVRSSPQAAEAILAQGQLVGVFPEGSAAARKPWRDRYRLQKLGRGFVKLALRTGAPLVPCAIVGSEEASPPISRPGWLADRLGVSLLGTGTALRFGPAAVLPLPSRWSLRFGPPVPLADLQEAAREDPAALAALTERAHAALRTLLEEELAARDSVFL